MTSGTALGLVIAILVIATVSNRGLAKPNLCCALSLPCCHGRRLEREPSAALPQRGIESRVEREPSAAKPPMGIGSRVEREPSAAIPPMGIGSRVEREPSAAIPPMGIGSRVEREPSAAIPPMGIGSLKDSTRPNVVNCIRHV